MFVLVPYWLTLQSKGEVGTDTRFSVNGSSVSDRAICNAREQDVVSSVHSTGYFNFNNSLTKCQNNHPCTIAKAISRASQPKVS